LCSVLGFLQYRSIGEISAAESMRLHEELRARLDVFRRAFDEEISTAALGLTPASTERYQQWRTSHGPIFARVGLAVPDAQRLTLFNLDLNTGELSAADWPAGWNAMRNRIEERLLGPGLGPGPGPGPMRSSEGLVFEIPRFGAGRGMPGPREQDWTIFELSGPYLRDTLLPAMLSRYLGETVQRDYDVEVTAAADPRTIVYRSVSNHGEIAAGNADESVPLLDMPAANVFGRGRGPEPSRLRPPGPGSPGQGRLRLLVRHRAGSLEALVAQTQKRNLAISAAVLLLILASMGMLLRLTRQSQILAELQINFVAGVSHELRTPLTVIRTAAYNLRGNHLKHRPEQIEQYARLIENESRKLADVVEQVLRFASVKAGHAIRDRQPVAVGSLIEQELQSSRAAIEGTNIVLEEHIGSGLPTVLADARALRHAFQNLMDNAIKYGTNGTGWIGVFAEAIIDETGAAAQIRVADHGPGIPLDEQSRVFDAFFRGRRAVEDQIRGTGLGLNLVKTIVEAHGGSIRITSDPAHGTAFTVRIPAAAEVSK
jgi:signal transduction histidine kinase